MWEKVIYPAVATVYMSFQNIFSEKFYEFNTWRAYGSETISLSFPFGFPILLSMVGEIIGYRPSNSIYLNCFIAFLTWISLYRLCVNQLKLPSLVGVSVCVSLIFNQFYIFQIIQGNTIPMAILLLSLSGNAVQTHFF